PSSVITRRPSTSWSAGRSPLGVTLTGQSLCSARSPLRGGGGVKELVYHRYLVPTADRLAGAIGVLDGEFTATFGEHLDRVCRLAGGLERELGVGRGDRFAVMALNGHQFLELYHASLLGGGVINPLNLRLAPRELTFIIQDSGSRVCVTDAVFAPLVEA